MEHHLPTVVCTFDKPSNFDPYALTKYAVVAPIGFVPIDANQKLLKYRIGIGTQPYWLFTELSSTYKSLPKKAKMFPGVWFTHSLEVTDDSVRFSKDTMSGLTRLGLTEQEVNALELLRMAAIALLTLPPIDMDEHAEYDGTFRVLQRAVLARAGLRALNWDELESTEGDEGDEEL